MGTDWELQLQLELQIPSTWGRALPPCWQPVARFFELFCNFVFFSFCFTKFLINFQRVFKASCLRTFVFFFLLFLFCSCNLQLNNFWFVFDVWEKTIFDFTAHLPKGAIRGAAALDCVGRKIVEGFRCVSGISYDNAIRNIFFKFFSRHCATETANYGINIQAKEQSACAYIAREFFL